MNPLRVAGALPVVMALVAAAATAAAAWGWVPWWVVGAVVVAGAGAGLSVASRLGSGLAEVAEAVGRLAPPEAQAPLGDPLRELEAALRGVERSLRAERRRVEQERTIEREAFRASPNGVLVVDPTGGVIDANPAMRQRFGLDGSLGGRRPIDLVPLAGLQQVIDQARADGAPAAREVSHGHGDLLLRAIPLPDTGATLALVMDVTPLRRAERARSAFIANLSHELRTPLTSLQGYAETLLADPESLGPFNLPLVEALHRNALRMSRMFNDLLELSRIEARQGDLPLSELDVAEVVDEVVGDHQGRARHVGVALVLEAPEHATRALANREALTHIVNNLVDNAVKYTALRVQADLSDHPGEEPRRGRVEVHVVEGPDAVRVAVRDTGPGIEAGHHERLFERFYRVDAGRARGAGGTGLGLAIVKHLCRATRARVGLESEVGAGSTFWVELPTR